MSYLAAASTFANALTTYYYPNDNNTVDIGKLRRQIHNDESVDMDVIHLFQAAVYDPKLILRHSSMFHRDVIDVACVQLFLQAPGDFTKFIKYEDILVLSNPLTLKSMSKVIGVSQDDCDTIRYEIISVSQNLKQYR